MEYIVALDFDYFDGDFGFGNSDSGSLLHDMHEDALSEGYIRLFDKYDEAASFAREVVARICDRAETDGDAWKEKFIGKVRNVLLHDIILATAGDAHGTFDYGEDFGNWGIRVRLLHRNKKDAVWEYPQFL